jgi:hypothetical protein
MTYKICVKNVKDRKTHPNRKRQNVRTAKDTDLST